MASISKSVGFGGANDARDVCTVQYLLNCVPASNGGPVEELPVDGVRHGPGFVMLVDAIRRFQSRTFQGWCDGRVDPGGPTLMHLNRWNPADASYGAYVKQGAAVNAAYQKGEDQSIKAIKQSGDPHQKELAAAVLKTIQDTIKGFGIKESGGPEGKGMSGIGGAVQKAVDAAIKQMGEKQGPGAPQKGFGGIGEAVQKAIESSIKQTGGQKGTGIGGAVQKAVESAIKGMGDKQSGGPMAKGIGGIGTMVQKVAQGVIQKQGMKDSGVKGGTVSGGIGGMASVVQKAVDSALKGMGIKGGGQGGAVEKGGFNDPFNMKGGGGGVNPGPGNIKGSGGQIN